MIKASPLQLIAQGTEWPEVASVIAGISAVRQFVRAVIVRITVAVDTIVIALNKCALRCVLRLSLWPRNAGAGTTPLPCH